MAKTISNFQLTILVTLECALSWVYKAFYFKLFSTCFSILIYSKGDHEIKKDAINIDLNKDIKFIPDFSLTLTEKCIYIKITRQSYIESLKLGNRQKTAEAVNVHNETYRIRLLNASKAKINKDQNETKTLSKTAGLQRDSRYLDIFEADETVKDGTKQLFRLGSDDETTKAYLMQNKC